MMRPSRSRPALAVVLTLALLTSLTLGVGASTASGEAPADHARLVTDEVAIDQAVVGGGSLLDGLSLARVADGPADGPSGRFGFSVLGQGSTSVVKTISVIDGVNQPANTTTATLNTNSTVTFLITAAGIQNGFVRDFLSPNFNFLSSSVPCVNAPAPGQQGRVNPPGVGNGHTARDCPVPNQTNPPFTFTIQAQVVLPGGTTPPVQDNAANVVCAGQVTPPPPDAPSAGVCSQPIQVAILASPVTATPTSTSTTVPAATATPTRTSTPTAASTQVIATAIATITPVASTAVCATQVGQQCTITGQLQGSFGIKTGSMQWTIIVPANLVPAGTVAIVVIPTNLFPAGQVLVGTGGAAACPVAVANVTLTCTGFTTGDGLIGGTVFVLLPSGAVVATGTIVPAAPLPGAPIVVPGAAGLQAIPRVAIPAVPAPPVQFIPPAPPPLLPPVGPLPPLQGGAPPPRPVYPEIPVIPEADTLPLLVGGLVILGGYGALRGWRSYRRRPD